jgi:hypothetical protein
MSPARAAVMGRRCSKRPRITPDKDVSPSHLIPVPGRTSAGVLVGTAKKAANAIHRPIVKIVRNAGNPLILRRGGVTSHSQVEVRYSVQRRNRRFNKSKAAQMISGQSLKALLLAAAITGSLALLICSFEIIALFYIILVGIFFLNVLDILGVPGLGESSNGFYVPSTAGVWLSVIVFWLLLFALIRPFFQKSWRSGR